MRTNTFGSPDEFPVLIKLTEDISQLAEKERVYLSSLIQDFHLIVKTLEFLPKSKQTTYFINLTRKDYVRKIVELRTRKNYPVDVFNRLANYFNAKLCSLYGTE